MPRRGEIVRDGVMFEYTILLTENTEVYVPGGGLISYAATTGMQAKLVAGVGFNPQDFCGITFTAYASSTIGLHGELYSAAPDVRLNGRLEADSFTIGLTGEFVFGGVSNAKYFTWITRLATRSTIRFLTFTYSDHARPI